MHVRLINFHGFGGFYCNLENYACEKIPQFEVKGYCAVFTLKIKLHPNIKPLKNKMQHILCRQVPGHSVFYQLRYRKLTRHLPFLSYQI